MSTQHLETTTPRARPSAVVIPALSYLMVTLDALVVVTALPSIRADLGGDPSGLQWVVNAYNLTFAAGIVAVAASSSLDWPASRSPVPPAPWRPASACWSGSARSKGWRRPRSRRSG